MAADPERELRIYANPRAHTVEIVLLADGSPIGSIAFTEEQATAHARTVVEAIEILRGNRPGSSLILPDSLQRH